MLLDSLTVLSDLGRLREIAVVLIEHGFGDFVQRTGIRRALRSSGRALHLRKPGPAPPEITTPERARRALEALGPTFVKLGQLLASRPDMLTPEWSKELSALQARVSTDPWDEVRAQVEQDLGQPPERAFATFSRQPIAAGSISQVYAATLKGGRRVVLKVRRPNIVERVNADLRLIKRIAGILDREGGDLSRFRPRQIAREFSRLMRSELDLRLEARNLKRVANNLRSRSDVVVPVEIPTWTTERLLVMTRVEGITAADWLAGERHAPFDPKALAARGADIVLQMIFSDAVYHSDPHPGNILFLPDGRVGLIDFGQVGRLSEKRRLEIVRLLGAVIHHDEEAAVDVLLQWVESREPDIDSLAADVRAFIGSYYGASLRDLDVGAALIDMTDIVRENGLSLPSEIAALIKALLTLEGLGSALDPDFNFSDRMEPAARDLVRQATSPRATIRRGIRDTRAMLTHFPSDLRSLATRIRRGQLKIDLDLRRLDRFGDQLERSANRLTMGMIAAALIIGTAITTTTRQGPTLLGWPVLGLLGFLCSAGIGIVLLLSIFRSGRP